MKRRGWVRFVVIALCLIVVGTIRSFVPDYLPDESPRGPDRNGVANAQSFTAELLDSVATRTIHLAHTDGVAETDEAFIVVQLRIRPTEDAVSLSYRVDTRDGMSYQAVGDRIASPLGGMTMHAATQNTISVAVEVPEAKLDGAKLVVARTNYGRIEPMRPVARFDLDDLGPLVDEFSPELDVVELSDG